MRENNLQSITITQAISLLLAGPLTNRDAIHLAEPSVDVGKMPDGFESHDAWELFCPLCGDLQVGIAGHHPATIPNLHLWLVPPGCLHFPADLLPQAPELSLFVLNLPGEEDPHGGSHHYGRLRVDEAREWMLSTELAAWKACMGVDPATAMGRVAQALRAGPWGRERALGMLRVLFASYAEVTAHPRRDSLSLDEQRVAEAQLYLQSRYFEPTLSVKTVAAALGLSPSHLGSLYRKTTGHTLHLTLIDLRLRRATDLLVGSTLSIKEIAAKTGWSNQFYFSAAYSRRLGRPPSAVRASDEPAAAVTRSRCR